MDLRPAEKEETVLVTGANSLDLVQVWVCLVLEEEQMCMKYLRADTITALTNGANRVLWTRNIFAKISSALQCENDFPAEFVPPLSFSQFQSSI